MKPMSGNEENQIAGADDSAITIAITLVVLVLAAAVATIWGVVVLEILIRMRSSGPRKRLYPAAVTQHLTPAQGAQPPPPEAASASHGPSQGKFPALPPVSHRSGSIMVSTHL